MDGAVVSTPRSSDLRPPAAPTPTSFTSSQISPLTEIPPPAPTSAPSKPTSQPSAPSNRSPSPAPPPYWTQTHTRVASHHSLESVARGGITLTDNDSPSSETSTACWAKSVSIPDYALVNGAKLNVGAFVVYNVKIETLSASTITLSKRYSEFDRLRHDLLMTFPLSEASMPPLPPKGVFDKFRPSFLEKRREGLQFFLNCVLLNPEFARSPVLRGWLFG